MNLAKDPVIKGTHKGNSVDGLYFRITTERLVEIQRGTLKSTGWSDFPGTKTGFLLELNKDTPDGDYWLYFFYWSMYRGDRHIARFPLRLISQ